jgi:hypothetical protein
LNVEKTIAGVSVAVGAIFLIYQGEIQLGAVLLSGMMGFFVGDTNGEKRAKENLVKLLDEMKAKT